MHICFKMPILLLKQYIFYGIIKYKLCSALRTDKIQIGFAILYNLKEKW